MGSKPIKVSMANQKSRAAAGGGTAQVTGLELGSMGAGRGHTNGSNGSWGSPLDAPIGAVSGPGGSATPSRGGAADSGWPGVQSQPTAAAAAAAWNAQPTAAAATHIAAAAATHPDFSTYQHYYSQYAQQFSQQQQQYAAAWSAWQQQQP